MLKRLSNVTIIILCILLVVGIAITRNVDTAIELNETRKEDERKRQQDFIVDCSGTLDKIITADTSSWVRMEYTLPSFSSYNLDKKADGWYMDTTATDAKATDYYLGKIAQSRSHCKVKHEKPNSLKLPDYILTIITNSNDTFRYSTFVVDTNLLVQSAGGQLYYGNSDSLFYNLYFGKQRFIPELAEQ